MNPNVSRNPAFAQRLYAAVACSLWSSLVTTGCSAPDAPPAPNGSSAIAQRPGGQSLGNAQQQPGGAVLNDDDGIILEAPAEPTASADDEDCDNILEVTYRDFTEDHVDFEMDFAGDVVRLNLLQPTLDSNAKPQFLDSVGCPPDHEEPQICGDWSPTEPTIRDADSFSDWYHTVDGVNIEFNKELELTETPPGSGVYVYESKAFFPLLPEEGFGISPRNHDMQQNFLFTTEIHLLFTYVAGQTFMFRGDDDLWIYINDRIALDLGSMHNAEEGTIDFDAQAQELGITPGGVYPMDVFHAERHTRASNFRIETNIGCFRPAPATRVR